MKSSLVQIAQNENRCIALEDDAIGADLFNKISIPEACYLTWMNGRKVNKSERLFDEYHDFSQFRLCARMLGGKGGFKSQLRGMARRMNKHTYENQDSSRDLEGHRIREVNNARLLNDYFSEDAVRERERQEQRRQRERVQALEGEIERLEEETGARPSTSKRKIDDSIVKESEETKDSIRDAFAVGIKKARKIKAKKREEKEVTLSESNGTLLTDAEMLPPGDGEFGNELPSESGKNKDAYSCGKDESGNQPTNESETDVNLEKKPLVEKVSNNKIDQLNQKTGSFIEEEKVGMGKSAVAKATSVEI